MKKIFKTVIFFFLTVSQVNLLYSQECFRKVNLKEQLTMPVDSFNKVMIPEDYKKLKKCFFSLNNVIDFYIDSNVAIKSILDGSVVSIFKISDFYTVLIRTGEYYQSYSNLKFPLVVKGDIVTKGQKLAYALKDIDENAYILSFGFHTQKDEVDVSKCMNFLYKPLNGEVLPAN